MNRFHLPCAECASDQLLLTGAEGRHAASVLRVRDGEQVTVLDGEGGELLCEVTGATRREVNLRVLRRRTQPPLPALITIFQALTKSKSMDWIIQKATELGAHRIVPITAARSVVHIEPGDAAQRVEKWMASAVEAAKQCGSAWLPRLELPLSLRQAIDRGKSCELKLVASLQTGANHARRCFDQFHAAHGRPPASVAVWVGPEGDFAPEEIELLLRAGVLPFTLGTLTLRSETAAVAALAIVNHETRPA